MLHQGLIFLYCEDGGAEDGEDGEDGERGVLVGGEWRQVACSLTKDEDNASRSVLLIHSIPYRLEHAKLSVFKPSNAELSHLTPPPFPYCFELTLLNEPNALRFCLGSEAELRAWVVKILPLLFGEETGGDENVRVERRGDVAPFKMTWIHILEAFCAGVLLNGLLLIILHSSAAYLESWFFVAAVNAFVAFAILVRMEQLILIRHGQAAGEANRNVLTTTTMTTAQGVHPTSMEELDDFDDATMAMPSKPIKPLVGGGKTRKFALQSGLQCSEIGIASPHSYTSFAESELVCHGCDLYLSPQGGLRSSEQMIFREEDFGADIKSLIVIHIQVQLSSPQLLFSKTEASQQPGYSLLCYLIPGEDVRARWMSAPSSLQLQVTLQLLGAERDEHRGSTKITHTAINKFTAKTSAARQMEVLEFMVNLRNLDLLSKLAVQGVLADEALLLKNYVKLTFFLTKQQPERDHPPTASLRLNLIQLNQIAPW